MPDLTTDLDGFHKIMTTIEHFTTGTPDAVSTAIVREISGLAPLKKDTTPY